MANPRGAVLRLLADREVVAIAGFCTIWAVVFLVGVPSRAFLAAPLVFLGVLVLRRHPRTGASVLLLASLVTVWAGVPHGRVDLVAAFAFALFTLGRMVSSLLTGALITFGYAASSAARGAFEVGDLVVSSSVFGAMWVFGVVVRRRALSARAAIAELDRLTGEDPDDFTAVRLAEERARLANDALVGLRGAVADMLESARRARRDPDPRLVAQIQTRGAQAVADLRELLELLREPPPEPPMTADPLPSARSAEVIAAAVLGLSVVGTIAGLVHPPENPELLLPLTVGYVISSWRAATHPSRGRWALLGGLAVLAMLLAAHFGSAGLGFVFVAFATPVLAGMAWGERERIEAEATRLGEAMLLSRDTRAEAAVRAERLRLARELHDVTSHAVGVMVLQAGAAQTLRGRSEERSAVALEQVCAAGEDALAEIDQLFDVLDTREFGAGGRAHAGPGELQGALEELARRMRDAGLEVDLRLTALPAEASLTSTVHRLVQEGLTNVVRHSPGAQAVVESVEIGSGWLVRISNDAARSRSSYDAGGSGGFGLTGLAERVAACGGTVETRRPAGGGFVLEARLPRAEGQWATPYSRSPASPRPGTM
ncbi:sensor histidine kinase [Nocardioides jensenii]|uniref:sensor histidine kinase n=1 Tax=Nocardioides jensenii TaxID=1843 RepID=UPI0008298254|nr:histidine kinase [Nocardioides jensenii]